MSMQAALAGLDETMTTPVTPSSIDLVARLLSEHFGFSAIVERLGSERDEIFAINRSDGARLICKITNPAEDPDVTALQTEAMRHVLRTDPILPVAQVLLSVDGQAGPRARFPDGSLRTVRVLTYLPGRPLASVSSSVRLRRSIGDALARLGLALRDFGHPAASRPLAWDMRRAGAFQAAALSLPGARWRFVREILARFPDRVAPQLETLRRQVVHCDFNAHNLLVPDDGGERIVGILDFGDVVETQLVNDVAIAACYQITPDGHPLDAAADVIAAYHAVSPLTRAEIDLLPSLIETRLAIAVLITEWRAEQHPEKRNYILKNTESAWNGLSRMEQLNRAEASAYLRARCDKEDTR